MQRHESGRRLTNRVYRLFYCGSNVHLSLAICPLSHVRPGLCELCHNTKQTLSCTLLDTLSERVILIIPKTKEQETAVKIAYARTHITHTHTHARTRTPLAPPHTHTHTHGPTGPSTRGGPVHPWEDGRLGGGPGDGQHASHACPRRHPHADAWRVNPTGHGGSGGPPAALAHSSCIGSVPGAIGAGCDEPDRSHRRQRAARQRASTSHATHPPMPPLRHAPHTCGLPAAHPSCPATRAVR